MPERSEDLVRAAWPFELRGTEPNTVSPSANTTVPPGVPAEDVTVAVKVTFCPEFDGFAEETTLMAVAAGVTTSVTILETPELRVALPL